MDVPFFQVPNAVFELALSPIEGFVYCYLARCGNNGKSAFPSYNTIAEKCGCSRRAAIKAVATLEMCGLIEKEVRDKGFGFFSNVYRVSNLSEFGR